MIIAAFILIAAGVLLFIFTPLFDKRDTIAQTSQYETNRRELLEQRDMIYGAIRELDFDYRMGKVEDDDYQQTRARYTAQAVEVMKALDKTNGRADQPDPAASPKSRETEDQIEKEIAAIRKIRNKN